MHKPHKKEAPFPFVLDALKDSYTKPLFGFLGFYWGEKIVLALRMKEKCPEDNGVWVATYKEHHSALKAHLPSMRSLKQFGPGPTDWQVIPVSSKTFEEEALHVCELILKKDTRIGRIPKQKKSRGTPKNKTKRKKNTKA